MYRLGEAAHRSHRKMYIGLMLLIVLLIAGLLFVAHQLRPSTEITKSSAEVTTHVTYDTTKLVTFTEPLFTISLPDDWHVISRSVDIPVPLYSWQGTTGDNAKRWLSVYVDQNVSHLAVNRELYVEAHDKAISVLSDVSDNCITFTGTASQSNSTTPAKWQGINFICDSGNYERDVVGVASPDGLNNLNLNGSSGMHHFFFTYTDNSISPDYTIFTNALKSFRLK